MGLGVSCTCSASCEQYVYSTYCFYHTQQELTVLLAARQSSNCMLASMCDEQSYNMSIGRKFSTNQARPGLEDPSSQPVLHQ